MQARVRYKVHKRKLDIAAAASLRRRQQEHQKRQQQMMMRILPSRIANIPQHISISFSSSKNRWKLHNSSRDPAQQQQQQQFQETDAAFNDCVLEPTQEEHLSEDDDEAMSTLTDDKDVY